MKPLSLASIALLLLAPGVRAAEPAELARQAHAMLEKHCHRCHGQDGAVEGGFNYILERDKLVARKKLTPGNAETSPLFRRVASGKMPPAGQPRPTADEAALLKQWIDAGAPGLAASGPRRLLLTEADLFRLLRDDLETVERRSRRFTRYFSLLPQYNLGLSHDELQTYHNALAKLLNSLSWHPRTTLPKVVDRDGLLLRIDLRDFMWDANLWNRLVGEYPYGVLHDTAGARAALVGTASRVPLVRVDWFLATASRAPLYYDLLQMPTTSTELERQLRIDVAQDIIQERVARAGFNGSGISKNNRVLERHDSVHGAYWRTYDFDAVPQNLIERDLLLPDRRNIFAYPLGPGGTDNTFQHAGGEVIFNLPNGLHAFLLVNANNVRLDKGPIAIVSDPKRPDRAVEAGVSCMGCHLTGILPKSDQIRAHVAKNAKAFSKTDAELVRALYPPEAKMKSLMEDDAERFRKALEKTGNRISNTEPVSTLTIRYEADVDLPLAAAEVGLAPQEFLERVLRVENAVRNLGGFKVSGGTVSRQVWVQSFADVARGLRLGAVLLPGATGQTLPDNTGEVDPLEAQSSPANAVAFSRDGRRALFASADKSVRLWDVETNREVRRFIGHTASVWCVAFAPDGKQALSGGADRTVRLWDVETGQELRRFEGHDALVSNVVFSPDGRRLLSSGFDHAVILWEAETGRELRRIESLQHVSALAFALDGKQSFVAADAVVHLLDLTTGQEVRTFEGHSAPVACLAVSTDGGWLLSGSDDHSVRLWDVTSGRVVRSFLGHDNAVRCVAFSPDGKQAVSGGADQTLRLWDVATGKQLRRFPRHDESVVQAQFLPGAQATLSGSKDAVVLTWELEKKTTTIEPPYRPIGSDPILTPPRRELNAKTSATIPGTLAALHRSPDGRWLFLLHADGKLERLDASTLKSDASLALHAGTETLTLSSDGKTLAATAPDRRPVEALIQLVDPATLQLRKKFWIGVPLFDLAVSDNGLLFASGSGGEWTDVVVIDTEHERIAGRWGGIWRRSPLRLAPDQKRLFVATQGVSPGRIEAFPIPEKLDEKPTPVRSTARPDQILDGDFIVSPDGGLLLSKTGTVLRASDMQVLARLPAFLAATVDPARGLFLSTDDGQLLHYSLDLALVGSYRLPGVGYQITCDPKAGRLVVAVFDPKSLTTRPRSRSASALQVYETPALPGK
jgi:WD40 repeat protein